MLYLLCLPGCSVRDFSEEKVFCSSSTSTANKHSNFDNSMLSLPSV